MRNKRYMAVAASQDAPLIPYTVDFSTLGDGALPSRFTGATWSISSGKAINTPNEGATIITNGDFETGSPPTGWNVNNSTLTADADAHGGSQAIKVVATSAGGSTYKPLTVIKDTWYAWSVWIKKLIGVADAFPSTNFYSSQGTSVNHVTPASYTQYRRVFLPSNTSSRFDLRSFNNGDSNLFDDLVIKPLILSELIAYINAGNPNVTVKAALTISLGNTAGVVCNLSSDAKYFIGAFHAGGANACMFKVINGVYTQLIDSAKAYSAGALIEIRKTAADVYQLWYNGAQVGADQTVTDASLNNNTLDGIFSTGGGSQVSSFFVLAS